MVTLPSAAVAFSWPKFLFPWHPLFVNRDNVVVKIYTVPRHASGFFKPGSRLKLEQEHCVRHVVGTSILN